MSPQNGSNGTITVAIAAIALSGKRNARRAQWLKIYEREEDKFYAVRPFLLTVKSEELVEKITEKIKDMVGNLKGQGFSYIGEISFEQDHG